MKKKITIEDLAVMVKRGFDDIRGEMQQGFEDIREEMATKVEMADGFRGVHRRIDLLHEDISDLPEIRDEVRDLGKRVDRIEKKVGFAHHAHN